MDPLLQKLKKLIQHPHDNPTWKHLGLRDYLPAPRTQKYEPNPGTLNTDCLGSKKRLKRKKNCNQNAKLKYREVFQLFSYSAAPSLE